MSIFGSPSARALRTSCSAMDALRVASMSPATYFPADAMISDLHTLLRQNRDDFRAAAIVCDIMLVEEDSDAIHVAAEHRDGSVFAAVLPYAANTATRTWEFGELGADTNEPAIWVD